MFRINMMVEWNTGNGGRASTDAGVLLEVPTVKSGVDPHPDQRVVAVRRVVTGWLEPVNIEIWMYGRKRKKKPC